MREYWCVRTKRCASSPLVWTGSDTTSTRGTIEWRAARCEKRMTRSKSSPSALPRGDRAALAARIARISSSLKRPSTLATSGDIPTVRRMTPRRALEQPEERQERDVDDAQRDRGGERRPLRALDGDELGHELAEEHVPEREDGERDRRHDDVHRRGERARRSARARRGRARPPSPARRSTRAPGSPA